MSLTFELAYGRQSLAFRSVQPPHLLRVSDPPPSVDAALFRQRVSAFLKAAGLDLRRPAVVVADKTRLCGYPLYLPVLLEELQARGAPTDGLTLFIAYGTHGRQSETACDSAYGEVYRCFKWVHHACQNQALFKEVGLTHRGTPVRLRADILDATCLITFGAISHHYFAGFGGGRKLIFPGLGEQAAIYANHALFLDHASGALCAGCGPGRLEGNPLAEDLAEVEAFKPADMAVHAILDSQGRVNDLMVGRGAAHFMEACHRHADHCEAGGGPFNRVLASCGGTPRDINFIQSHKAVHNAAAFVADGGRLIVLASCPDGIGSLTFLPWFEPGGFQKAFERLSQGYAGNGGTALAMMEKTRRIRIALVTDLDASVVQTMGCEKLSLDEARREVSAAGDSWAVIPNAGLLVRKQDA